MSVAPDKSDPNEATGAAVYGGSSVSKILRRALSLVGARIAGNILTLGYTLILARLTTPAEFGIVMVGFAWSMLLSVGLALNVESGSIRYLVQYRESDRLGPMAGFLRFNRLLIIVLSAVAATIAGTLWAASILDAGAQRDQVLAIALLTAPIAALTRVYARHATALGQVLRGGLPIMLVRPGVIFGLLAVVWLSGATPGPVTLMFLLLVAFMITALVQAVLLRETFGLAGRADPEYGDRGKWLVTGAMMAPLLLLRDNLKHVVVASAGLVLSPAEAGYVALAMSVMALVYFAMKAVDISLSPQLSQALQGGSPERVVRLMKSGSTIKLAGLSIGVLAIGTVGAQALGVFGPEYRASYLPLMILMLIPAADAVFGPAQIVLNITGRQSAVFWVAGVSSVVLVVAIVLGGRLAGAEGAAFGAGLAYLVQQALLRRVSLRSAQVETSIACLWAAPPTRQDMSA